MVIAGSRSHDLESPEWLAARALVKAGGTLVVLMGASRLRVIVESLISAGCAPTMPISVISKGTYLVQDCRVGILSDISQDIHGMKPPAVIINGEVVSL
jgi:uroporphyrin-III C-methyltransferase/precorrin-2 dehydrogenase/sirohydrochlorin ferrochelatase